jgi:1,4-alpha-glucan branching enzyme
VERQKFPLHPAKTLLTADDLHLFNEGRHHRAYMRMGAHVGQDQDRQGVWFSVWAPGARNVSVIGDFNGWNREANNLDAVGDSGLWSGFIPNVKQGEIYKYFIVNGSGIGEERSDPFAFYTEIPPKTGSRVWDLSYQWRDKEWMKNRKTIQATDKAMSVYEVHLGSWKRKDGNESLSYRELAETCICKTDGFHARGAYADHGTSILWIMGLSVDGIFRADFSLRHSSRFHVPRGQISSRRNWRAP